MVVQLIEGLFYIWLVYNFNEVTNVTPKRYIDWSITTPTMLITLIIYLIYLRHREKGYDTTKLELFNLLLENSTNISYVLFLNWLMLIFGYLGETKNNSYLYSYYVRFYSISIVLFYNLCKLCETK